MLVQNILIFLGQDVKLLLPFCYKHTFVGVPSDHQICGLDFLSSGHRIILTRTITLSNIKKKVKVMNLRFQIRLCHSSLITAESIMMNHEAFRLFLHSISIYRRLPASKFGFRVQPEPVGGKKSNRSRLTPQSYAIFLRQRSAFSNVGGVARACAIAAKSAEANKKINASICDTHKRSGDTRHTRLGEIVSRALSELRGQELRCCIL